MSAVVASISRETPVEFIRRNGPTLTHEVAIRFGMSDPRDALRILKGLEAHGLLTSRRVSFERGAGLEWTLPPASKDTP